jgi:hypothetical protein
MNTGSALRSIAGADLLASGSRLVGLSLLARLGDVLGSQLKRAANHPEFASNIGDHHVTDLKVDRRVCGVNRPR